MFSQTQHWPNSWWTQGQHPAPQCPVGGEMPFYSTDGNWWEQPGALCRGRLSFHVGWSAGSIYSAPQGVLGHPEPAGCRRVSPGLATTPLSILQEYRLIRTVQSRLPHVPDLDVPSLFLILCGHAKHMKNGDGGGCSFGIKGAILDSQLQNNPHL